MEEQICLVIKAPSSKYDDFKISCQLSWTILDLKLHICKEYPSKPNTSDQRLIYSGHLLKDEQHLRDIIELSGENDDSNNTYTFHLVCSNRSAKTTTTTTPASSSSASSSATTSSAPMPPNSSSSTPSSGSSASRSGHGASTSSTTSTSSASVDPMLSYFTSSGMAMDESMRQSYFAMMQQYCQYMNYHYMTANGTAATGAPDYAGYLTFANAYMRGMNGVAGQLPNSPLIPPGVIPANLNQPPNNNNNNVPAAAAAAVNENRNNNNNNRAAAAAAAAAAVDPNEENNRDWMDMTYSFCKAMVMLSIMYFYSSIGRLLLLLSIIVFLYLYKTTRLQNILNNNFNNNNNNNAGNNNEGQEPVAPVQQQPQREEVNNNNINNRENEQANQAMAPAAASPDEVDNNTNAVVPDNSRYTGLRLVWVFVSSLFTSLIPDPVPLN